jgi:hypothetical protein
MNFQYMRAHRAYSLVFSSIKDSIFEHNDKSGTRDMQFF